MLLVLQQLQGMLDRRWQFLAGIGSGGSVPGLFAGEGQEADHDQQIHRASPGTTRSVGSRIVLS